MAASLPGPLGGELAGAERRGVPDGLSPVLRRRGAGFVGAGAIALQPPGTWGGRPGVYKRYKPLQTMLQHLPRAWHSSGGPPLGYPKETPGKG